MVAGNNVPRLCFFCCLLPIPLRHPYARCPHADAACVILSSAVAPSYGVPVVLHTDHCAHKLLPWFDGMLDADEAYFKEHGYPLFSSHMLDLSEESKEENIATCEKYFTRMAKMNRGS